MDTAYDHIQEAVVEAGEDGQENKGKEAEKQESLNAEFAEAYKAFSNSPWGAKFGAFMGTVKKQGETYLETTKKEYSQASQQFTSLASNVVNRTRGLSLNARPSEASSVPHEDDGNASDAETIRPSEGIMSRIKAGLTELEKVEARADEYIFQFGSNIGNFLKEAVTIAPPEGETFSDETAQKNVLFENKEDGSKRKIYTTRLDAQLHLLHTNVELFKNTPTGAEYADFAKGFSADAKTEQIAKDLDTYPELRTVMESLVPDSVQYAEFWKHYYFLRAQLDTEEQKRKEILKGAVQEDEEVGWDDEDEEDEEDDEEEGSDEEEDSDEEEESDEEEDGKANPSNSSRETLQPAPSKPKVSTDRTSQADSDTSYDIVSGAPSNAASQAGGSPPKSKNIDNDSDDEDWE